MIRDPSRQALTREERLLLGYLHCHAPLPAAALTIQELVEAMNRLGLPMRRRDVESALESLRGEKGRPVGSSGRGIFCYADAAGGAIALALQRRHLETVARHYRRMLRTVQDIGSHQTYLDLAEADAAYRRAAGETPVRAGLLFAGARDPAGSRT